jgi:hypothetical protein
VQSSTLAVAADGLEGATDGLEGAATVLQCLGGVTGALGDAGEQDLSGDIGVTEFSGELLGRGQGVECVPVEVRVGQAVAGGGGVTGDEVAGVLEDAVSVHTRGLEDRAGDGILLLEDRDQQVGRTDVRIALRRGRLQCGLHGLLGTGGGGETAHVTPSLSRLDSAALV